MSSLSLNGSSSASTSYDPEPKMLLLIDDIPNVQNLVVREAFHAALENFVASNSSHAHPLVVIISDLGARGESWYAESGLGWRERQRDAVDYRTVFPKTLQASPCLTQISYVAYSST